MLERLDANLVRRPGHLVELHPPGTVTLNVSLHPHKGLGPHRLWARKATPQPPGECGKEKKCQRGNDQQSRKINEILWPDGQRKEMKLTPGQIE